MQYSTVALLAFVAAASAQTPPGCSTSYSGTFEISPANITASGKRDLSILERQAEGTCTLTPVVTLSDGILTDAEGRTGEIVSNYQLQFDKLTQSGAKFTSGFSICDNGTLAIAGSAIFYGCASGNFDNLYSESIGAQCHPVYINIIPCLGPSGTASVPPVTASSTPSAASSTPVTASSTPVTASSAPAVTSITSSVAPLTMTMAAPFPVANSTTVATGTAVASTAPTTATTSAPATFTPGSGANVLAAGSKVFAAMVGLVAFAMF